MKDFHSNLLSNSNLELENCITMELDEQLARLNPLWHQNSNVLWIKGDRNTRFFHAYTLFRRRTNFIPALKYSSRILSWDHRLIDNEFVENFIT